ncbi:MAG: hypothetical protein M1833_006104 [Piccolia ochrophora]|nr:MAG: hypothetical protein M1833_006104 [Piccolia ochrophora]
MAALSPTTSNQQRQPPPSLFLGPPSRDSSHVELPSLLLPGAHASSVGAPVHSSQRPPRLHDLTGLGPSSKASNPPDGQTTTPAPAASGLARPLPHQQQQQHDEGKRQADHTDALWAEMQNTLEEVEISAENGTHVFGAEHSRALEDLRTAQIALAQAWARSEADEVTNEMEKESKVVKGIGLLGAQTGVKGPGAEEGGKRDKQAGVGDGQLEEETENDILLARKRREANDRYFQRVNGEVLDVVAKLDEVAAAMRSVERESRGMWSESSESLSSSSPSAR